MKKVLSLVLVLAMVLGSFSLVSAAPLSDIAGTEYEAAVDRLTQLGALDGYPDGTFKPSAEITRAEFAAALIKTKGLKAAAVAATGLSTGFTDVPATNWASGYVGLAAKLGIVNGVGNNKFDPNAPVTYEQAVTMIMRALGYEPAAASRGGYPYGYLILASEQGLLESVKGTQGTPALRGTVAQLLDNALETPMMVQSGYGPNATWVVSGTQNVPLKILLDELGFDNYEGRVVSVDADRNRITLENENGRSKTVKVNKGFDFNFVEGLIIKVWFANDTVVVYSAIDEANLVATTVDGAKIKFGGKSYKVAKDAYLELNDAEKEEAFEADYAKVVLNDENEVVWAKGYTLPEFIVVKEVKDDVVYGYNKVELDVEDFVILKDGKTLAELEEGDVLFYNNSKEFAIVYNNSLEGEIERVYTTASEFKFEGKVYGYTEDAKYLDGNTMGALIADELAAMVAEEKDVEIFLNTKGKVVLVVGNRGKAVTNSFYGILSANSVKYDGRKGKMLSLDVRNEEGKIVSYDLTQAFIEKTGDDQVFFGASNDYGTLTEPVKNTLVKITVNNDDVPTRVDILAGTALPSGGFKLADTYTDGYRLQSSTLIFHGTDNKFVEKLGEVEDFTKVTSGRYHEVSGRVVVVYNGVTDADSEAKDFFGLVTKVRDLKSGAKEFTFADGKVLVTESTTPALGSGNTNTTFVNKIVQVKVGDKTGNLLAFDSVVAKVVEPKETINSLGDNKVNLANRTIEGSSVHELTSDAVIYDITGTSVKTLTLRELAKGDKLEVYKDETSARFVKFVVRTAKAQGPSTPESLVGVVTDVDADGDLLYFVVDSKTPYFLDAKTILTDSSDKVVKMGATNVHGELALGDKVEVSINGEVMTIKRLKTAEEMTAAVAAAVKTTFKAEGTVGAEKMPEVPAGYTIAVKSSSDVAKYDGAGKIVEAGTSDVVYTVSCGGTDVDTSTVVVTVVVVTP